MTTRPETGKMLVDASLDMGLEEAKTKYHYIFEADGTRHVGVPIEDQGDYLEGFNDKTTGALMLGTGVGNAAVTRGQLDALKATVLELKDSLYPEFDMASKFMFPETEDGVPNMDFGHWLFEEVLKQD